MTLLPPNSNYSDKDFESLRSRLFDLINSVYPKWTTDTVHNFGNILIEGYCFVGDVLGFYQDQHAREGRFGTVQLRKNMIALTKLIEYQLKGATASTCDVLLTITNYEDLVGTVMPSNPIVIIGTSAITNPIRGEIQGTVSFDLSSSETSKTFDWQNSLTQTPYVIASTGKINQRIFLPFGPFLTGSDLVETLTQGPWLKVESFFDSGPSDPHYRVSVDQNDRAEYIFGDGKNGVIPVGNITCKYKTGGGIFGNVESGSLKNIEGSFVDSEGNTAHVVATNEAGAEGGSPREEVEAARVNAPESIRVLNRTVAREDYEINAKRVDGVGRPLMLTSNEEVSIGENRGKLFIIPKSGGTPSQAMLDAVTSMVTEEYPKTITFQLEVLAAVYKTINVRAVVFLQRNTSKRDTKAAIIAALEDFFEPMLADGTINTNVDYGWNYKDADGNPAGEVSWSDVFNVVRDLTTYVRKVDSGSTGFTLNGLRSDVSIPNWQFPKLGAVTIINGDDGTEL